jgi:hypothetical protein
MAVTVIVVLAGPIEAVNTAVRSSILTPLLNCVVSYTTGNAVVLDPSGWLAVL